MQDRDGWPRLLHLAELRVAGRFTFKVVHCLRFGGARGRPRHVADVAETRYSTRSVAFFVTARGLARVVQNYFVLRYRLSEKLVRVSRRVSTQFGTGYLGVTSCFR